MNKLKLLIKQDNTITTCTLPEDAEMTKEHIAAYKAIIDIEGDTFNGVCLEDVGNAFQPAWVYDFQKNKVVIDKVLIAEIHLETFRILREEAMRKIDYKLIDASALGDQDEVRRLLDIKKFLRDYPTILIKELDKYTIDYLKSQPTEVTSNL